MDGFGACICVLSVSLRLCGELMFRLTPQIHGAVLRVCGEAVRAVSRTAIVCMHPSFHICGRYR